MSPSKTQLALPASYFSLVVFCAIAYYGMYMPEEVSPSPSNVKESILSIFLEGVLLSDEINVRFFLKDHAASNKLESDRYNSKLILAHLMFKMCNKLPHHDLNAIYIAIQNIRWVFFFWSYILECFLGIERLLA